MTTEALTMIVVDILGKFVVDKGATLLKEAGQAAAQAAFQLCELVLTRLKEDPADAKNAERFEKNPEGYQAPITDAIQEKLGADPNFSAQLLALVEEYRKVTVVTNQSSNTVGSGAVATQGSVAAGEGGVAILGNVRGAINVTNTNGGYSSEGSGP